jgi:hypothetical protein
MTVKDQSVKHTLKRSTKFNLKYLEISLKKTSLTSFPFNYQLIFYNI